MGFFINVMKFGKRLAILWTKIKRKLIYNRNYLKEFFRSSFHYTCKRVILILSVHKKLKTILLTKTYINKDIEIYSNNSY